MKLSVTQFAAIKKVSRQYIHQLIQSGKLTAVYPEIKNVEKVGSSYMIEI